MPHWILWAFQEQNAPSVAGWGFWLAILGLVLTVFGFVVTLIQLNRTKGAAEAAKAEAKRIQDSFARYEVINEASRAAHALTTARTYVRNGLWAHVPDNYQKVRESLEAIKDEEGLGIEMIKRIEVACRFIQNACTRIESDLQNNTTLVNPAKTISVMREQSMLVAELTRIVQKRAIQ